VIGPSQTVALTIAKELFGPLLKVKLGIGNGARTMCDCSPRTVGGGQDEHGRLQRTSRWRAVASR